MRNGVIVRTMLVSCVAMWWAACGRYCHGSELRLVQQGTAQAVIVAGPDARAAADRLNTLVREELGTSLRIVAPGDAPATDQPEIVLCTASGRANVRSRLPDRAGNATLKPEGFLLAADAEKNGRVLAIGADAAGLRYAVGELWNYYVRINGRTATIDSPLWLEDAPAYSKRILWNWSFQTNWDSDLRRVHQTQAIDPGGTLSPYLEQPDGYEKQFQSVIDYAADHKLNGLIIYGFINDSHGGVDSAKRLSHYAKTHSIRILPGVGTVIYGGFYLGANDPNNPYSLTTWLRKHPEVRRMIGKDGAPIMDAPCASSPELRAFLIDGARWFFSTFKDIGGVNIEHGDFFECHCETCKAERAKPGNDPNFLWDMMNTHLPVIETGHGINPDLWYTYSPYWGYKKEMMAQPPRFLKQYPEYAIVQWTYSGMVSDPTKNWPADLKPPAGAKHSIGLLHQGSYWFGPRQWWNSPGQTYALIPDIIQQTCSRAIDDGSEGLEIVGQIGSASPQNDLNYLAFEEFTWHPKATMEQWVEKRLAVLYGDAKLAKRFLQLVGDETTSPEAIEAARTEADQIAARLTDPRQTRRWGNLAKELARRAALVKAGNVKPFGPGPLQGVENLKIEF